MPHLTSRNPWAQSGQAPDFGVGNFPSRQPFLSGTKRTYGFSAERGAKQVQSGLLSGHRPGISVGPMVATLLKGRIKTGARNQFSQLLPDVLGLIGFLAALAGATL